jgi:hypothetical protein
LSLPPLFWWLIVVFFQCFLLPLDCWRKGTVFVVLP